MLDDIFHRILQDGERTRAERDPGSPPWTPDPQTDPRYEGLEPEEWDQTPKAAAAFLVFKEMERALDVPAQDASDFMMKCRQADASQRRWNDLLDDVCRLPARSAPGRYAKHRLAELLGRLEPSAPQDGAFDRIIVSAREDKARFGSG